MLLSLSLPENRTYRITVSAFFFIAGLTFATWASRIPDIKSRLNLSDAGLGSVLFALPVGLMVSLPLSGWLVTRFGSRKIVIVAALVYPLILTVLGLAAQIWQLAAILFVFGLVANLFNISVNTQAVGVEALYGRSIMASFHGVWSVAGFTGAFIGSLIISLGFSVFAHFCIICASTALTVFIVHKYALPSDCSSGSQPIFAKPDKTLLKLGLIAFCCMVSEGTMFDWSGIYFQKVVNAPKELITLGYVAFMSTMAAGRFVGDKLANRIGKKTMLQLSGIVIAAGLLIAVIFPTIVTSTIGFLLVGFGVSSVVPLVYGEAGKSTTMSPGVALAAVSSIGFLGFLIGPPMIGFIAEASNLRWSFSLIALLGFCTTILAGTVKMS
jgi:MFS family permease